MRVPFAHHDQKCKGGEDHVVKECDELGLCGGLHDRHRDRSRCTGAIGEPKRHPGIDIPEPDANPSGQRVVRLVPWRLRICDRELHAAILPTQCDAVCGGHQRGPVDHQRPAEQRPRAVWQLVGAAERHPERTLSAARGHQRSLPRVSDEKGVRPDHRRSAACPMHRSFNQGESNTMSDSSTAPTIT